ncbi:hypothetical protein EBL_c15840 [Shimwellia blattae DSM 4481 = NBRC 105725]|uniref:Uncharacterized protein n=1 Tax=Shimwellia blattae (strain ATCC 29907 / DSM 4481 / JCM 1650 / NBRC 105725 / CDC 9005-74) TaxID=630626 RepID=I2B824_SHIBC|nr:hypothetical protein EBL_c15840 [Shimwellia blattae DSM 4481 = NBRC 105725]
MLFFVLSGRAFFIIKNIVRNSFCYFPNPQAPVPGEYLCPDIINNGPITLNQAFMLQTGNKITP